MAFLDNVGKALSQAGQDAIQKTKDIADISRLNSTISEEEKNLVNQYQQIGKIYSQLHKNDYEDCFASYILSVEESLKKIEQCKAELIVLRDIAICPKCGAEQSAKVLYCNTCGGPMPKTLAQSIPPEGSVKCNNCGAFVNKNMKFCTTCGLPMAPSVPNSTPETSAPVETQPRKCSVCGTPIIEGSSFCLECGTKI